MTVNALLHHRTLIRPGHKAAVCLYVPGVLINQLPFCGDRGELCKRCF